MRLSDRLCNEVFFGRAKMKNSVITVMLIAIVCSGLIGFVFGARYYEPAISSLQGQLADAQNYIPDIAELQQRLNGQGYYCEVDGIYGPATGLAWDRYYCDKMATKLAGHYYDD